MSYWRSSSVAALAVASLWSAGAAAQSTTVGQQWLTGGLSLSPALVTDKSAGTVGAVGKEGAPKLGFGGGLRARIGFQHVVASAFTMAAEVEVGNAYFGKTTIAADGFSPGGGGIAWQAGLVGRWVPRGDMTGPALGVGLHTFRAKLPETPIQTLSGDLRFGWFLWKDEHFVLAEFGYAVPFLEGIQTEDTFDGSGPSNVDQDWTIHRFVFGFSYGF